MDYEFVPGRDDIPPDGVTMLRKQLADEKAEFEQCSTMLNNAERHIETLEEQLAAALAACEVKQAALQEIIDLMSESYGLTGFHLNGDIAPWSDLEEGGRFERLTTLPEALAIKPDASALKAHDEALIERCADAAELEILGDVEREDDEAYNIAVKHCAAAIRELKKEMFPAVNHQQGDMRFFLHRLPDEVEAFASGRTYGFAGKRKYNMSPVMQERYRLLRRKFAIISDGDGHAEFCAINLPRPTYIAPSSAIELDAALDRERLGLDGVRPPTPAGWSDTDWIKHLQEQEGQHPLEGLHINYGSLDAAADAYEAEYNEAQEARRAEHDAEMRADAFGPKHG